MTCEDVTTNGVTYTGDTHWVNPDGTYTGDTLYINPSIWYTLDPNPQYTFITTTTSAAASEYRIKLRLCFGESKKCEGCRKALACMSGVLPKEVALVRNTAEGEVTYYLLGCDKEDFLCLEEEPK